MADVLIVDDEADIRNIISDLLSDEGYSPRTAYDADSAFAAIEAAAPDLIILDIWLQGSRMDGIEILKSVKRDNPGIPIVIISGHGNIEVAVAAVQQGAYDFIEKPFNMNQLLVVVARALEASRLRRENARLRAAEASSGNLVGSSPAANALRNKLERVARGGAWFFTDNDDFLGELLDQGAILNLEADVVYRVRPGMWASFDVTYFSGGRRVISGEETPTSLSNTRLGGTFAVLVSGPHIAKFTANTGLSTRSGNDFNTFAVSYTYGWTDRP